MVCRRLWSEDGRSVYLKGGDPGAGDAEIGTVPSEGSPTKLMALGDDTHRSDRFEPAVSRERIYFTLREIEIDGSLPRAVR